MNMMAQPNRGIIAAGHPKTAEAGIEMFRAGGNAFDAAVAAMLASFVAEPVLTSAGGGGFLLAHTQDDRNILFDFFAQTPRSKKQTAELNFYPTYLDFGKAVQEFHIGLGAIAVPGNLAGAFEVHQKLGRLPLPVVAEPAIHYAKNGIEVTALQSYCFNLLKPILLASEAGRQIYAPGGNLIQEGEILVITDLADTLAYLAAKGVREFYEGEIAGKLIEDCQTKGGHLTREDLTNYRAIAREPLSVTYRGNTLLTNPPPSSGGTLIAFALQLLSKLELSSLRFGTSHHLQILADVMRLTNLARQESFDANLYRDDIAEIFLNSQAIAQYDRQVTEIFSKWGSTTHISVADREGNAASVTTSNGEGCGYFIPGTGVMMNNMLGEADLSPNGFHHWRENVRISSMMAPTIVLKGSRPEIVLGSGGSNRIRTAILQVICNFIDFQMPPDSAVNNPRVHWENKIFNVEPGFEAEELKKLSLPENNELVLWQEKNLFFGGVHAVVTAAGGLSGAGDRRRGGVIMQF